MAPDQLLEQKQAEKQEVKGYFETTGFDRWNRIYSESDDVNKVQRNIRIGHQKPVDEVILVNASDMKRPSTSSLSSSPSDLGCPQKKRLRTKKRVVIGKTHNKLEEAICNEAEIQQQNGDEKEETEAEAEAKLQPLLTHNSRQDTLLMLH